MKKYLIIFSALVLAASACAKFIDETPTPRVYVDSPSIQVSSVKDSAFTATVTPVSGTGYYSVVVTEGAAKSLDSIRVFKLSVSPSVYSGTFAAAKVPASTIDLVDLKPNTEYTVYTVSSSTQGSVGKLVSKTIKTSDTVAPFIVEDGISVAQDTLVTFVFSETVALAEKAVVTAKYYALNKGLVEDTEIGSVEGFVQVNGKTATVAVPTLPNGAYYCLEYAEGTFIDAVGNKCAALAHQPFTKDETTGTVRNASKASGRKSTVAFELSIYGGKPVTVVTAMNSPIWISVPEGVTIAKNHSIEAGVNGSLIYMTGSEEQGYAKIETFITSGKTYDFGWNGSYQCALAYPNAGEYYTGRKDPERGSYVIMGLPAYLEDIYGNMNAEFTIGPFLFSYGYTIDDVLGTYEASAYEYYSKETKTFDVTIVKSDDATKGNVMITEIFGSPVDADQRLYADFNGDLGMLTIPDDQKIWLTEKYGGYWYFAVSGADYLTLSMTKSGTLGSPSAAFGTYVKGSVSGWGAVYQTFDAVKKTSTSTAAPTAVSDRVVHSVGKEIK